MKCDELEIKYVGYGMGFYPTEDVDAAIAELKAKLEDVQATAYTESVDACMENRRLKRALWMARAERAMAESYSVLNDVPTSNRWVKALNKLNVKAKEYK